MPSSPRILKETILETAFKLLIREGYSAINIKTVAKELGCSTQPISRQFGSMDGLRNELLEYSLEYFQNTFCVKGNYALDIVLGIAQGYINLACDYPNVYKYFYMSEQDGEKMGNLARSLRTSNHNKVIAMLEQEHNLTVDAANEYMRNMDYYVHGIASYAAIGFTGASKEDLMDNIRRASEIFLIQAKRTRE